MSTPKESDGVDPDLEAIAESLAHTQGSSFAVYHILMELVIRIARAQPDPSGFLKSMFESVSAKLDQRPPATAQKQASGFENETLSTFFSVAEKAVRTQKKGGPKPRSE